MATFPLQPTVNGSTLTWTLPHITGGQTITLFVYGHLTSVGTAVNIAAITSGYCTICTGVDTGRVDVCGPE